MGGTPIERLSIDVAGGRLAAERRMASNGPPVVLLHAGVADLRSWRATAASLGDRGLDVLAYDRRGFGGSPPSSDPFTHLSDLLLVLDFLDRRPALLVGSSMGGGLALDAALEAPERIAGLVLIAPAVSGKPETPEAGYDAATRALGAAIDAADAAADLDEVNRLEIRLWLDGPAGPEGRVEGSARDLALDMNRIALENEAEAADGASGVDAWSRLGEIEIDATVAWGGLDIPDVIATSRLLAERLPRVSASVELTGTAHLPYLEEPDAVAELIAAAARR